MTSFVSAVVAVVIISLGASIILETQQRTADRSYTTGGARVDLDPRLNGGEAKH
jgi:hypothetical protein